MHRGVESEYMWGSYGASVSGFKKTMYQMRERQSHIVTRFGEILSSLGGGMRVCLVFLR